MATLTSGYSARDGGSVHHIPNGGASSTSSNLGFGISTANGSEDHCIIALAGLFQQVMNDMKGSTFIWEDFLAKSTKLHAALKATLVASSAFLDAFQRVADVATNARGATKEIGKCLTRMVLRQRSIEAKLKTFTSALMDCLVTPLNEKTEDWKKTCLFMDKEHSKENKKCRQEIKKRSQDTMRLQKKTKKGSGSSKVMESWNDVVEMKRQLQDKEFEAVRQAMIEERSRFCLFVSCLKPFLDEELGMLGEMVHLEEISDSLVQHTLDPFQLPPASIQALLDVKATCSSNISAADLIMQDHIATENYYSSSCSSGSNQWGNYLSPPPSPLPGDPISPHGSKLGGNHDVGNFRDHSLMGNRHGSICSISNVSNSSFGSNSSYGENNSQDKTLCAPPKSYRRCLSDNNGQEQHYYPSSITSSIPENDAGTDEEDNSNQDTLIPTNHKRKPRPRRSSMSHSEEIPRHYPLSLAVRNEYYSTIRFSSISSGDSGFISHPDRISAVNSREEPQGSPDSLLTPTTQKEVPSQRQDKDSVFLNNNARAPPVPPFGSVGRAEGTHRQQRPQTISGYGQVEREDPNSCRQVGKYPKRPALTQETYNPMLDSENPASSSSRIAPSKDLRRTCHLPDMSTYKTEAVYANSNLLNDTSALPPPPDHWMDDSNNTRASPNPDASNSSTDQRWPVQHLSADQVNVPMTIRRAKRDPEVSSVCSLDVGQSDVVFRNQQNRPLRPHSQYGSTNGVNKGPPPPLPVRRTPSLHQSLQDMDDATLVAAPEKSVPRKPVERDVARLEKASYSSENHINMINSVQERLRQNHSSNPTSVPPVTKYSAQNSVLRSSSVRVVDSSRRNVVNTVVDVRASVFHQIRTGVRLRKVNPAECRDRSSPLIRK